MVQDEVCLDTAEMKIGYRDLPLVYLIFFELAESLVEKKEW